MIATEKKKPKLYEIIKNPDGTTKLNINLHDGQRDALNAQERFVLMLCGSQSGKTSFAPIWLMNEIAKYGPGDYLAVSATFDLLQMKLLPELKKLFCDYLGYEYYKADKTFVKYIQVKQDNGDYETEQVRIICRSAESKKGLESATAKSIIFDEAGMPDIDVDVWYALRRRATICRARVLITTTPYNLGWLKTEVYDRCLDENEPDYKLINFKSTLNPLFSEEEFEDLRRSMPEWKFKMFYEGEFTRPASMIYDIFDFKKREYILKDDKLKWVTSKGNMVKSFKIPDSWQRYIGVDFGAVNSCVVFVAEPPNMEGTYIIYNSLHGGGSLYEKVAAYHKDYIAFGGADSEDDWRSHWALNGVPVKKPKIRDIETGIERTYSLMKRKRLYVMDTCDEVLKELRSYAREVDTYGNPTDNIADKNKFHHMDAMRYICTMFYYDMDEKEEEEEKPKPIINPLSEEGTNRYFHRKAVSLL